MKKAVLFIFSGSIAAFSSLFLFVLFWNYLHIWYLAASVTSFILSVFIGFYLQKYLTFRGSNRGRSKKEMILFFIVSSVNLGITIVLMLFFVEIIKLNTLLSKVCTLAILACWNFFVYEKFVFNRKHPVID